MDGNPVDSVSADSHSVDRITDKTPRRVDPKAIFQMVLAALLVAFTVSVLADNILPTSRTLCATEQRLRRLEIRNNRLENAVRAADHEAERLRTDPWAVERILRDEFNMSQDGEQIVR